MPKFNDLDLTNWKELDIDTNSLWIIKERDKSGKHKNIYHGNFIPQIPYQLISRYTKANEIVIEPFMGSGTTLFECENLNRKYIGFDINEEMLEYVDTQMSDNLFYKNYEIFLANSLDKNLVENSMQKALNKFSSLKAQFLLMHPPYMDVVKFTNKEEDLSQIDKTGMVQIGVMKRL